MCQPYMENATALSDIIILLIYYIYVFCGPKKLNHTLVIDSPFQTFMVGLLVEFIDLLYHCFLQKRFPC